MTDSTKLFEAAFCAPAHEAQQAGRAALRAGDDCAVMILAERAPHCQVRKATVLETDARYVVADGHKFHRDGGWQARHRKSARVSRTLYAITPEVEAWFAAKRRSKGNGKQ